MEGCVSMRVSLLFVGDELVDGLIENTNASWAKARLQLLGVGLCEMAEVRDDPSMIAALLDYMLDVSDVVVISGGLGPTEDDVTREAVSKALGRDLVFDEELWAGIEERLRQRGVAVKEGHRRMAMVVEGAKVVENPVGLAPGQILERGSKAVVLIPAPPAEFQAVFDLALERLGLKGDGVRLKVYKLFGLKESEVNARLKDLLKAFPLRWGTVIDAGEVWINLKCPVELEERVEGILKSAFGEDLFGVGDETLPVVVGRLLREKGLSLSVAESCTGGLLASMITDVSGSSDYFAGGVVSYLERVKEAVLGVDPEVIRKHTVYSHEVARQMAEGVRRLMNTDLALATTGIAGPTGGTPEKPVGLVYVGLAHPKGVESFEFFYGYDRVGNKRAFAKSALDVLRRFLLKL